MNIEAKPAIYLIFCLGNQKSYVGQSKSVKKRIADHRAALRNNRHINEYLQSAFNKYGMDLFDFRVLEYPEDTTVENLIVREAYWMDFFDSMNREKGFNLKEAGSAGILSEERLKKLSESLKALHASPDYINPNKGKKRTEEARQKMSEAKKGKPRKPFTEESRRKMSEAGKGRVPPNKGIPMTEEQKEKISEAHKGRPLTEEHKEKMRGPRGPRKIKQ